VVADPAGPAVLPEEAGDQGSREAGYLLEVPLHQALVGLSEAVVLEADQSPAHEGVHGVALGRLEVRGFIALEEGADVVKGAEIRSVRSAQSFPIRK